MGCRVSMCFWMGAEYCVVSRRRPRSKRMRVTLPLDAWCWTRKEKEGTVLRALGDMGVMNWWQGSVNCPADRAWTVTKGEAGVLVGGDDMIGGDVG